MSPQFSRPIELDYCFEEVQKLKFSVYDLDNDSPSLDDDDFLGCLECSLGEVSVIGGLREGMPLDRSCIFSILLCFIKHVTCNISEICFAHQVVSAGTYTKPLTPGSGKKSKGKLGTMTVSGVDDSVVSLWSTPELD